MTSERNVVWRRCLVAVDTQTLLNEQMAEQNTGFDRDGEQNLNWSWGHEQSSERFLALDVFKIVACTLQFDNITIFSSQVFSSLHKSARG